MCTVAVCKWVKEVTQRHTFLPPVVDIGSGDHYVMYKNLFKPHGFVKLDLEQNTEKNIELIADACKMPQIPSSIYYTVTCFDALEHMYDPFAFFREASRILERGGHLLLSSVACWPEHKHPKDYWRFLPDGYEHLCEQAGLKVLEIAKEKPTFLEPCHVYLVAQKK